MTLLPYDQIKSEWEKSRIILESIIDEAVYVASIPNGYGSHNVYESAQQAGLKTLCSSIPTTRTFNSSGMEIVGRYVIHDNTSDEDFYKLLSSKWYRSRIKLRYYFLQFVHLVLGNNYNKVKTALLKRRS